VKELPGEFLKYEGLLISEQREGLEESDQGKGHLLPVTIQLGRTAQIYRGSCPGACSRAISQILAPKIERQLSNIDEQIRKLKTATPDGWEDQS